MTESLAAERELRTPERFTKEMLEWHPWLEPLPVEEMTPRHIDALVQPSRVNNEYFRLLARDPDILRERTKTDFDIFFNKTAGLPRADREIAATAASRRNGCVYCASVHAGFAAHHSRRGDDVQQLLDNGVSARTDPRWDAIVDATVALTATPSAFADGDVDSLAAAGLDDDEILDAIYAGAFFNWANRLMLSLGEPSH